MLRPCNPNTSMPNRNSIYLASSGGGKSQAVLQNPDIPTRGVRLVGWDHAGDHAGLHYTSKRKFIDALCAGIAGGKGFQIHYAGESDPKTFEWWCGVVWGILDGRYQTYIKIEEVAMACESAGRAPPNASLLANQGRKFGAILHAVSQFPQEVPKTFYRNCPIKYIGQQMGDDMHRKMAKEIGLRPDQIAALQPLEFYRHDGSAAAPELIKLKHKKPAGVRWPEQSPSPAKA